METGSVRFSKSPVGPRGGFEPTTIPIALSSPAFRPLASAAVTPAAETTTRLLAVLCNVLLLAPSTVARRGAEIVVKTLHNSCVDKNLQALAKGTVQETPMLIR